jgi:Ser/Thr protein kinase RdoA (MazF antagonist)
VAVVRLARDRVSVSALPGALKEHFERAAGRLCERLTASSLLCIIHRDLYAEQVIVCEDRMVYLDLDEVALGEAELDVGNFTAHLLLRDLQRRCRRGSGPALRESFLQTYRDRRDFTAARFASYEAAALLRLASLERLGRPEVSRLAWPELAAGLLDAAEQDL